MCVCACVCRQSLLIGRCESVIYSPPELRKARTNLEAIKKQAESTNKEYDRLAEEHQTLQVRGIDKWVWHV